MKVLLINSVCGIGSTGRIVSDLWQTLKLYGHEAKVVYGCGVGMKVDEQDIFSISSKSGYYVHNILSKITDKAGFYSKYSTYKLISFMKKYQPDIVHLHNIHGYYINIKILFTYLKQSNIKVIWTLHDCWPMTGHCAHFSYVGCERWKTQCLHCPAKNRYPRTYFWDNSKRNYEVKKALFTSIQNMFIVTPSNWLAGIVKESFLKKYPVEIIPNGIDLETFRPLESNFREQYSLTNKKIVLAVANVWGRQKGMYDIFKMAPLLNSEYQIVMVGLSDEQMSLVPDSIIPIKRTKDIEELVKIYSAADVFINPSYEETMGMVTAEALACGTPAIVYNKTAVPEVIDDSCGFIVNAGDIEDMVNKICNMPCFDKETVRQKAKKFEKISQYAKYYNLYKTVFSFNMKEEND